MRRLLFIIWLAAVAAIGVAAVGGDAVAVGLPVTDAGKPCGAAEEATLRKLLGLNRCWRWYDVQDGREIVELLRGDTISFQCADSGYTEGFLLAEPDTLWLKKKHPKEPKVGRDFLFLPFYRGVKVGQGYATPLSELNNRSFGVLSATIVKDPELLYNDIGPGYAVAMQLVDLESVAVVEAYLPIKDNLALSIRSNRINRLITSLIGCKFYYRNQATAYKYRPVTLDNGAFRLRMDSTNLPLRATLRLLFRDEAGHPVSFPVYGVNSYTSTEFISEESAKSVDQIQKIL
jgi:hypothetical protein